MSEFFAFRESNCKNCYKCIRHCPVKAIGFSGGQAHVMEDACILCGACFVTCPQNAKILRGDLAEVQQSVVSGTELYVSVAPSFAAAFPDVPFSALRETLMTLGFRDAEETALGATMVKQQYEQLIAGKAQPVIISSCCHSINLLVQKYFPDLTGTLAKVVSPMIAHGMSLRQRHPGGRVVFIGPCISKKAEAREYPGVIDQVLTFDELADWLGQKDMTLPQQPESETGGKARLFPTTGGVLATLNLPADSGYTTTAIDGVENCMAALRDIAEGGLSNCFIEMSTCFGSCISGPVMSRSSVGLVRSRQRIEAVSGPADFDLTPLSLPDLARRHAVEPVRRYKFGGKAVEETLRKMGKTLPEHELNCGSCGYDTCREKAEAILAGKAEVSMCLPFLMARSESFSDNIIKNTPNAILVLNRDFEVQRINTAACQLMNVRDEQTVRGRHVVCIMDPTLFEQVIHTSQNSAEQRVYLAEYKKHVMMTVLYDSGNDIVIAIMRDVTTEQIELAGKNERSSRRIELADKIIEKQMRTVQEIASLLGETTAETKVALEKLKETILE